MSESPVCLLMDQGGQSSRVVVMDPMGKILAEAQRPVAVQNTGDGRVELDGPEILAGLSSGIREVLAAVAPRRVASAALAVQRGSVLCWRRGSGEALSPVLSWQDRRAAAWPGQAIDPETIRQRTGLRFSPYGGALKLRWCLDTLPAVGEARAADDLLMGPLGSYLLQGLLRERPALVDPTLAQRTLLYDRHRGDWSDDTLAAAGLVREELPRLVASRGVHGHLRDSPVDCPLKLLMGDQNAVPWMAGSPREDTVYINLGTGAFILRPVGADTDPGPFQFTLLDPGQVPAHALEASVHGAGAALQWLARERGRAVGPAEVDASLADGVTPPLFINTVGGLGSPWWQSGPAPHFLDETGGSLPVAARDPGQLAAIVESLCFLIRVNLAVMEDLAGPVRHIVLAGGLSRSDRLCHRLACLLGRPLSRLNNPEGTLLGLWWQLLRPEHGASRVAMPLPPPSAALERRFQLWRARLEERLP